MPCYHPLPAIQKISPVGSKGTAPRFLKKDATIVPPGYRFMRLPCGQCIGCRLEKSRQWAIRCVHESLMHDKNVFITLTYDDDHLKSNSLNKRDFQLFMKRLRKARSNEKIKFYHCGEYGKQCKICGNTSDKCDCKRFDPVPGRPHHHACIFGTDFPDRVEFPTRGPDRIYVSDELSKLWPYGFNIIGEVTFESAAYCARYIAKKITGNLEKAREHYGDRMPEYATMSLKPAIGAGYYAKNRRRIYSHDEVMIREGLLCRPPKYYDSMESQLNPYEMEVIKYERLEQAERLSANSTRKRLHVRERVKENQTTLLKRSLEDGTTNV